MAHVAGLVAAGVYPEPGAVRRRRHDHHAQDAARPARRPDPGARERRDHEEAQLAGVPGHAGRPADARDRRQGGGLPRGAAARVRGLPAAGPGQCARDGRRCSSSAATASSPAAPTTTCSWSTCPTRTSPARTPTPRSAVPTSPSTRTRCRTIRARRSSPAASASARRPSTTRGFKEAEVTQLADWIADVLDDMPATRR